MTAVYFPTLPGVKMVVTRTPEFDNTVQRARSGRETRIAWRATPLYRFKLSIEFLRQGQLHAGGTTYAEFSTLVNFYNARMGRWDWFYFVDPYDGSTRKVRFDTDKLDFDRMFEKIWEVKTLMLQEIP